MGLEHFNQLKSKDEKVRFAALELIVKECKNAGGSFNEANKAFDYALGRLVKGMQSNILSTRVEFFAGLVTLLTRAKNVNEDTVMDLIDKALVSTGGDTKNERRMMNVARIMAYGAVIKAKCCSPEKPNVLVARKALKNIVEVAEKKKAFRSLATPFVCHLLNNYPLSKLDKEIVSLLEPLLVKEEKAKSNLDYLKLVLSAENRDLSPSLGSVDDVEELVEIIMAGVDAADTEVLNLIFNHLKRKDLFEEFWKLVVVKLGPYQSQLFCTCVSLSINRGCPLKFVLKEEVIQLALSTLHTKDLGTGVRDKAVAAFQALLTWKEEPEGSLTPKERKKALQILYKGTPNLLHEYQILVGVIKTHLQYLSAKELKLLAGYLMNCVIAEESSEKSMRNRLSAVALLSHIVQMKNCSTELQVEIAKLFFRHGFCEEIVYEEGEDSTSKSAKAVDENLQHHCSSQFLTSIRRSIDIDFVTTIYDYVVSILKNAEEGYKLRLELDDEVKTQLKRSGKLLGKITEPTVDLIVKVGAMQLVTNTDGVSSIFEDWLDLAKKSIKKDISLEIVQFIVEQVVTTETPFFNYDAIFRRFAMDGKITEEAVQILAGAIDVVDDNDGDDSDIDDSDDDDEDDDGTSGQINGLNDANTLFARPAGAAINGDSGSEDDDIDMDDAPEEDLKKMDEALAGVFAAKKRHKDQSKLDNLRYMRVLKLVDTLVGRFKEPPISVVLILLMPLVSSVKNNIAVKANQTTLKRTLATLKRLNRFKKFTSMEEVDLEVLSTMASEIRLLMKKKTVPKEVKNVLSASINNLLTSSTDSTKKAEKTNGKKTNRKNKKPNPQSPTQLAKSKTKSLPMEDSGIESQKSKKKQVKKVENNVGDSEMSSVAASLPVKRKAQGVSEKKKAKLRRMQVLNEGLSMAD